MPERSILICEREGGIYGAFLRDYFSDTPAAIKFVTDPSQMLRIFDQILPAIVFLEPSFLTRSFAQKIKVRKSTLPSFRVYGLGDPSAGAKEKIFDAVFADPPNGADFNRRFLETLPVPPLIKLLVVDDEKEIGDAVFDYCAGRKDPSFEIKCVSNGQAALASLEREKPDVIILDIKMPVMDGREFYAAFKAKGLTVPVIVFFDSISGEELAAMRKFGSPAVVEKGYQGSSLPILMALVKKLVYFNA